MLIYLGCLGLLLHSHETSADALQVSLVASLSVPAVRLFETHPAQRRRRSASTLGLLVLTRGWLVPLALWLGLLVAALARDRRMLPLPLALAALPCAAAIGISWPLADCADATLPQLADPGLAGLEPAPARLPRWHSLNSFFRVGIWFFWPAWPFAGWAV